jgi:anti-sigma factor RsiW
VNDLHCALREQLGAFALGHLDRAESAEVRTHLVSCPSCRAELDAIAPLRRLLRGIDPERVSGPPGSLTGGRDVAVNGTPPPVRRAGGLPVRGRRVRGGWVRGGGIRAAGVVTAAAAVAAVGFLLGVGARPGETPPVPVQEQVAVRELVPNVAAEASLVAHTWGTEVKLTAAGLAKGKTYRVVVTGLDGQVVAAGSMVGTGEETLRCNLNAAVLRPAAAGFTVLAADGTPVLRANFGR